MANEDAKKTLAELSRDLQESKARLEEAQRVAHVGYWVWNLDTDRVTWSDEAYRIYGLMPQQGPVDLSRIREMIHPRRSRDRLSYSGGGDSRPSASGR